MPYEKRSWAPRIYTPGALEPFKISRSKIDLFTECPRCFYLDARRGVKRPSIPSFTLNSAVDHLLKKEFDIHRALNRQHPLQKQYNLPLMPFAHRDLDKWRHNFTGVQHLHTETNLFVFGAVDDIWINPKTKELHIVDYKSTSTNEPVTLEGKWKEAYKRQMEVYQWLMRRNGFTISDVGYFVYVNGRKDVAAFDGKLEFDVRILPYEGRDGWIEKTLLAIKEALESETLPPAGKECEYCTYRKAVMDALPTGSAKAKSSKAREPSPQTLF